MAKDQGPGSEERRWGRANFSGDANRRRYPMLGTFWTAFANKQETYAFEKFGGCVHSLGQEDVRLRVAIVDSYLSREQDGGSFRRNSLDLLDEPGAIETGHDQVGEDQVYPAPFKQLYRVFPLGTGHHPIASGFKQDFTNGKSLLVVIHA